MGIIAAIKVLLETLKSVGLIRDRKVEADIQAQFLASTSGPLYGLARVTVIYMSLWDLFFNGGKAWATTGLSPILEYMPIAWLFIGPAIVPIAEAALRSSRAIIAVTRHKLPTPAPPEPVRREGDSVRTESIPVREVPDR